jgi:hypothetical protein
MAWHAQPTATAAATATGHSVGVDAHAPPPLSSRLLSCPPNLCVCHPINTPALSLSSHTLSLQRQRRQPSPSAVPPHSSPPQLPPFCPPTFQPSKKPPQSQPTPRHAKRNPRSCDPAAPGRSCVPVLRVRTNLIVVLASAALRWCYLGHGGGGGGQERGERGRRRRG